MDQPNELNGTAQAGYDSTLRASSNNDATMGGTEDNSSTIIGGYNYQQRPQTSQSADFPSSSGAFTPQMDQHPSPNLSYQQQGMQTSRPSSGLSGANGHSQSYQEQNHRAQQEAGKVQSSVVIKVGMVGDAQIGKTSLMVKYVEGSWDEDYIQTLGRQPRLWYK